MNSALYGKIYRIPQNIVERIRAKLYTIGDNSSNGVKRAKYIINNAQCSYQMLKRLKNFFDYCDPTKQLEEYELAGGKNMQDFVERTLNSERNLVSSRKKTNVMFMPQLDQRSLTAGSGRHDLSVNENEIIEDSILNDVPIETDEKKNALAVILSKGGNEVLLLKRAMTDIWMPNKWALVGGKVEGDEEPLDGVIREIKEETGLEISEFIGYYVIRIGEGHIEYVYVAVVEGQPSIILNDEHIDYGWFETDEINKLDSVEHLDDMVALAKQKLIVYDIENDETINN